MSLEHEILGDTDPETIINDFACKNAASWNFLQLTFFQQHTLTEWQRPWSFQ